MDRIAHAFNQARQEGRAALVAYLCAGDPTFDVSLDACRTLLDGPVDILEVGMPFSDPLADGITNQLAAQRALENGMTVERCFELVRRLRAHSAKPIIFYTYYNLVFSRGVEAFAAASQAAGLDGMLTLDLPPEEATEVVQASRKHALANVFIIAPTTPEARMTLVSHQASGFIYYVSREGVTGVRESVATNIPEAVAAIRQHTPLPVAVGFGIAKRSQVNEVARHADGVVVGSVLVNCIARNTAAPGIALRELKATAEDLAAGLSKHASS
jgi:tryptophan synthase alpha chain